MGRPDNHFSIAPVAGRDSKRFLVLLFVLFLAAVGLKWHGYSFSLFRELLDPGMPHPEVIFGRARAIRTDDFGHDLPLQLAQYAHQPRFPVVNSNIGNGQNMLAPNKVPVWNFVEWFRPSTWGYFFGADRGLSWEWYSLVFGLAAAWFLLLMVIGNGNASLAIFGALILVYSPFFQFWSLHKAEIPTHAALAFVALIALLSARRKAVILAAGFLLGWQVACFVLHQIYPPHQVAVGYLFLLLLPAFLFRNRLWMQARTLAGWRCASATLAVLIVAVAGWKFHHDAGELIQLIQNTVYPGRRVSTGGGHPFWLYFNNNFAMTKFTTRWEALGNQCEAASFLFFSPLVFVFYAFHRRSFDALGIALFAYLGMMCGFAWIGLPASFAKLTLFSSIPVNRVVQGLGLADSLLVFDFLANRSQLRRQSSPRKRKLVLGVWAALLGLEIVGLLPYVGNPPTWAWATLFLANLGLGYLLITPGHERKFAIALLGISLAYTFGFNPLVRGGADSLAEMPLARKILAASATHERATWATFSSYEETEPVSSAGVAVVPRVLGLRTLNGVFGHPQFSLWRAFDRERKFEAVYNQLGYTVLRPKLTGPPEFKNGLGTFTLEVTPDDPAFREAGVTHFLVVGTKLEPFENRSTLKKVDSYRGIYHLYELRTTR